MPSRRCWARLIFRALPSLRGSVCPIVWDNTVFALFGPQFDSGLATTAIITIMPLAFATMIERVADLFRHWLGLRTQLHCRSRSAPYPARRWPGKNHLRPRYFGAPPEYDVWREHRRACAYACVRPARDSHCRLLRHRAVVLPQVCCCDRCYARRALSAVCHSCSTA